MNTLENKIQVELVSAMKNKQTETVSALRAVKTAVQVEKTSEARAGNHELTDDEIVKIIQKQVKQRKESIEIYTQAGRIELAEKEKKEMEVLSEYLPKTLTTDELHIAIDDIISVSGANSLRDMGAVMKTLKEKYPNQYDGRVASDYIKERLSV